MSGKHYSVIAAIGIDIGKTWFHVVGLDGRGAIALRQKFAVSKKTACRLAALIEAASLHYPMYTFSPSTRFRSDHLRRDQ